MPDNRDLSPDNGQRPPFAKPVPEVEPTGRSGGYSGQEYDSPEQVAWRKAEARKGISPDGEAHGTGAPGEEIDPETPGS